MLAKECSTCKFAQLIKGRRYCMNDCNTSELKVSLITKLCSVVTNMSYVCDKWVSVSSSMEMLWGNFSDDRIESELSKRMKVKAPMGYEVLP